MLRSQRLTSNGKEMECSLTKTAGMIQNGGKPDKIVVLDFPFLCFFFYFHDPGSLTINTGFLI